MTLGRRSVRELLLWSASTGLALACSVGTGEGAVSSEDLFVHGCWQGEFNLRPTFFAANPFDDTLTIRIQRGEQDIQVSDGVALLVNDVPTVRASLGTELPLGLPVGVAPLGFPLPPRPEPPAASLSLYLNSSCRGLNAQLVAIDGQVVFDNIFSGDLNEEDAEDRLTQGRFSAIMADPQSAVPAPEGAEGPSYVYPAEERSTLEGEFSFFFHRGTPAQPFP